jgi:hypothetical protein
VSNVVWTIVGKFFFILRNFYILTHVLTTFRLYLRYERSCRLERWATATITSQARRLVRYMVFYSSFFNIYYIYLLSTSLRDEEGW